MKTSIKILIGFLAIIILGMVQMGVTYTILSNILSNTRQIKNVEVPIELMFQQGGNYISIESDQLHSAMLRAQKGDYGGIRENKAIYDAMGMKLNDLFNRDSLMLINQSIRSRSEKDYINTKLKEMEQLNSLIFDMGVKAFAAIDKKDIDTAYSLTMGGDYEKYQKEIQLAGQNLAGVMDGEFFNIENGVVQQIQQLTYFNLIVAIVLIAITLVVLLIMYFFFSGKEKNKGMRDNRKKR